MNVAGTRYCSGTDLTDEKAIQSSGTSTAATKNAGAACRATTGSQRQAASRRALAGWVRIAAGAATSGPLVPEEAVLDDDEHAHDQRAQVPDRRGVTHPQPALLERDLVGAPGPG